MKISKHAHIEKILKEMLDQLPPESKIPAEIELAKDFGVSRMTMNKVIGRLVDDGILYRVKKKGTFKKDKRTLQNPIYFIVPTLDFLTNAASTFHKNLLTGVIKEAKMLGRKIEILPINKSNTQGDWDWDTINTIPTGAQVLVPSVWYRELFHVFHEKKCDVVTLNNGLHLEEKQKKYARRFYTIEVNRKAGTESAVLHLIKTGKKRPLLIYEHEEYLHPIIEGYKSGIHEAGLELDRKLMIFLSDKNKLAETITESYSLKFDSIILATQSCVKTTLAELKKNKRSIPDDVAVLCLEHDLLFLEHEIPVTTMVSPVIEAGREAIRIFNRDVFLPGETRLRQTLLERESTRKGVGINIKDSEDLPEFKVNEELSKLIQSPAFTC